MKNSDEDQQESRANRSDLKATISPKLWVFLRGLGRDKRHWTPFFNVFKQQMNPENIISIDLPGNGDYYKTNSPTKAQDYLNHVRERLDEYKAQKNLPADTPVNLVAISFGGMIAMQWLKQCPKELQSVYLINTSMKPWSKMTERLRIAAWPKVISGLFLSPAKREISVRKLTTQYYKRDDELLAQWQEWAVQKPVTAINILKQIYTASRFKAPELPKSTIEKITIIVSAQDELVHPDCSLQIAKRLGADIITHPRAGHDLPLDEPEWLCKILLR